MHTFDTCISLVTFNKVRPTILATDSSTVTSQALALIRWHDEVTSAGAYRCERARVKVPAVDNAPIFHCSVMQDNVMSTSLASNAPPRQKAPSTPSSRGDLPARQQNTRAPLGEKPERKAGPAHRRSKIRRRAACSRAWHRVTWQARAGLDPGLV